MLTTAKCRNAELREKVYKLIDSDGLMLKVYPSGAKTWIVRHCIGGKDKEQRIGEFPHMTLAEARKARDELKARLRSGETEDLAPLTFNETMQRWLDVKTSARKYDDKYLYTITHRLEKFVLPELGSIPITQIKRRKVMAVLDSIVREGHGETASRVAELIQQVFVFALGRGIIEVNPCTRLNRDLPVTPVKSFQYITDPEGLGRMLYRVDLIGSVVTRSAAQVVYYCFPRIGELLESHWSDIDFERGLWTLPAAHTKMRRDHIIPFPSQVRDILLDLREYETEFLNKNAEHGFVFPARNPRKESATHITEASVLKALKNIVVAAAAKGVLIPPTSVHGFRHTASTILHGLGENTLVIEKQMAHLDSNRIRAVYNSYEFLNERREMLQRYADYLDNLKKSADSK